MKKIFICQLSKKEQLEYFKAIKKALIENDCFNYENLSNAMNSKIVDLEGLF